jgi:hypothetical protein
MSCFPICTGHPLILLLDQYFCGQVVGVTESAILVEETFHRTLAFMGPVIVVMLLEWICANHLGGYLNAAFLGRRIHGIFHGSHYVYPSQAQWYVPFASILDFRCQDKNTIPGVAQMFKNDVLDWKT